MIWTRCAVIAWNWAVSHKKIHCYQIILNLTDSYGWLWQRGSYWIVLPINTHFFIVYLLCFNSKHWTVFHFNSILHLLPLLSTARVRLAPPIPVNLQPRMPSVVRPPPVKMVPGVSIGSWLGLSDRGGTRFPPPEHHNIQRRMVSAAHKGKFTFFRPYLFSLWLSTSCRLNCDI